MKIERWQLSPLKHKKYRVWIRDDDRLFRVDFGDSRYQQFRDRSPLKAFSNLDHNDPKRRERYYKRHKIDYPPFTADYVAKNIFGRLIF
jgi:hypothetical protein